MKTTSLVSLVALSLGVLHSGCAGQTPEDQDGAPGRVPELRSDVAGPKVKLIALTAIDRDEAPALGELAGRFGTTPAGDLDSGTGEGAGMEAFLDGAGALVADASRLDARAIDAARPLVHAASQAGIPLILENVTDPAPMAALVGVGFEAELALVEPSRGQPRSQITLFGDTAVTGTDTGEPVSRPGSSEPHEEEITARLVERLENPPMMLASATVGDYAPGTYWSYLVKRSTVYTWCPDNSSCPTGTQTATMDVQFQLQLVASKTPSAKFLVVSDAGAGMNPGSLTANYGGDLATNGRRAWFQEGVEVSIVPTGTSLSSYSHQPTTANQQNQYSVSNGCSFGGGLSGDGPSATFSCNLGTSSTQSVSDFTIFDNAAGLTSKWNYNMSYAPGYGAVQGSAYDSFDDLLDGVWTGALRDVPALAKSNLDPFFEVVYQADAGFTGTVPVTLSYTQSLRDTWTAPHFFWVDPYSTLKTATIPLSFTVDFDQVNVDHVPLVAKHSLKCLGIDGGSTATGAAVLQATCSGVQSQHFEMVNTPDLDGYKWIKPQHDGLCLTVSGGATTNGTAIIQKTCDPSKDHQRFLLVDSGNGYSYLKAKHSNKCIRVDAASTADGAAAVQWTCNGADDHRFR